MQNLNDVARPGIMISQTWPRSRETEGATLAAMEQVLEKDYFTAIQTVEIPYPDERKKIARVTGEQGIAHTYCVARVLNDNGLNLSDLDESNRRKSADQVVRCLDDAREAGASSLSFISGKRPSDAGLRERACERLGESLVTICEEAAKGPPMRILVEPLDTDAHKMGALGTTAEALALCRNLKRQGLDLWICIDTAHARLNGEDPMEALSVAQEHVAEFHYCNCVTDPSHPLFGDRHIRFGEPGVLDVEGIADMMRESVANGFFSPDRKPVILGEVLKMEDDDSPELLDYETRVLQAAWETAQLTQSEGGQR